MKKYLICVMFIFFLFGCSDRKYEGYCVSNSRHLLNVSTGKYYDVNQKMREMFTKYSFDFMADNNFVFGYDYSNKTFVTYSIKDKKFILQCKLGDKKDEVMFSGFSEKRDSVYYYKNTSIMAMDLKTKKENVLFNLKDEFNLNGKTVESMFYNEEVYEIYVIFSMEVEKHKYDYKLYKIDIRNFETILLAQRYRCKIQIYYNYFYNQYYYSCDENVYMISGYEHKKLKIKNKTTLCWDLSIACIDENTIIYKNAKFNLALYLFGSESFNVSIYDHKNQVIQKLDYAKGLDVQR